VVQGAFVHPHLAQHAKVMLLLVQTAVVVATAAATVSAHVLAIHDA